MQLQAKTTALEKQVTGCLIVAVHKDQELSSSLGQIDKATSGAIKTILDRGDLDQACGSTLLLSHLPKIEAERVLLVRCENHASGFDYINAVTAAFTAIAKTPTTDVICCLEEIDVKDHDLVWKATQTSLYAQTETYRFLEFKSDKKPLALKKVLLHGADRAALTDLNKGIERGSAIADGILYAKNLGQLPPNICNPSYLATQAKELAKTYTGLKVTVLDEKQLAKLHAGGLLGVGQGSATPPRLITLEYHGADKKDKPIVFVGKGITFDSGGISIKPAQNMEEMKYDMMGAASVLGLIKFCCEYKIPLNVVGVIATAENMPSGSAYRPGDILTTMSGKTIEITNTDAEGRVILCDALTYCERFNPDVVIDMATLTGAVIVALGHEATGIMGNNQALIDDLLTASQDACDRAWQLPLWDVYRDYMSSDCADIKNAGGREAGTITGAIFLSHFAEKYPWAHLDIAGTAWKTKGGKMATGRPIPLLVQYLLNRSKVITN